MNITYIWYFLAALTLLSALMVILVRNPIHSVLYLIMTFFLLSSHYILLNAQFLAAVNIIVYAGAIMVLFLFVIMFLNLREYTEQSQRILTRLAGMVLGGVVFVVIVAAFRKINYTAPSENYYNPTTGFVETLGQVLFRDYLLPFELITVLFFVAMVGAVLLGKREKGERHF